MPLLRLLSAGCAAFALGFAPVRAQEPEPAPDGESLSLELEELAAALEAAGTPPGSYFDAGLQEPGSAAPPDAFRRLDDLLPTPSRTRGASGAPGPDYWQQQVDYSIRVRLDEATGLIAGVEDVTYHNNSPEALDYLWVQLDDNWLAPDSLDARTATVADLGGLEPWSLGGWFARSRFDGSVNVTEVSSGGAGLEHFVNGTMMRVDLPAPLAPGARLQFRIAWNLILNPAGLAGSRAGVETFEDGSSIFEAAHWYPRLCVFDDVVGWQNKQFLGNGEFALEFGDFEVAITVPDDHVVAATGLLQNPSAALSAVQAERWAAAMTPGNEGPLYVVTPQEAAENILTPAAGERTWIFRAQNVRDFAWASSRRFIWDCWGIQVREDGPVIAAQSFWPPEGEPLWSRFSTRAVAHALQVYSRHTFDYPYPSAASVNGPVYGMEYPMICFNAPRPSPWGDDKSDEYALVGVVIHEVGHNFFPMILNSDERQWTWMDEGLNTFVESIAEEEWEEGFPTYAGDAGQIAMNLAQPGSQPLMTSSDSTVNFGWNGYAKPAAGLHLLRNLVMGPELFDSAFRVYARRWMFKRPQPADFFRSLEDASAVNLDWFWRGWFYETSHVDLRLDSVTQVPAETLEAAGAPIGAHAYVAAVVNEGGLVAPLVFLLEFEDGEWEERIIPVEVWRRNPQRVEVVLATSRPLARLNLDPAQASYDAEPYDGNGIPGAPGGSGGDSRADSIVEILQSLGEGDDPNFDIPFEDED